MLPIWLRIKCFKQLSGCKHSVLRRWTRKLFYFRYSLVYLYNCMLKLMFIFDAATLLLNNRALIRDVRNRLSLFGWVQKLPFTPTFSLRFVWCYQKGVPILRRETTPASWNLYSLGPCVNSTEMPARNAANILRPLAPNPHSAPFTHVAPFSGSQRSSPLLPSLTGTRLRGNHHRYAANIATSAAIFRISSRSSCVKTPRVKHNLQLNLFHSTRQ